MQSRWRLCAEVSVKLVKSVLRAGGKVSAKQVERCVQSRWRGVCSAGGGVCVEQVERCAEQVLIPR